MKTKKLLTFLMIIGLSVNLSFAQNGKKIEKVTFKSSITCQKCVNVIMNSLPKEKGVTDVNCDVETKQVTVSYKKGKTDAKTIKKSLEKLGYTSEEIKEKKEIENK